MGPDSSDTSDDAAIAGILFWGTAFRQVDLLFFSILRWVLHVIDKTHFRVLGFLPDLGSVGSTSCSTKKRRPLCDIEYGVSFAILDLPSGSTAVRRTT